MKTTSWKIVEKSDRLAVHSIGYHGHSGKAKAQERIDSGDCLRHWLNRKAQFIVVPQDDERLTMKTHEPKKQSI